FAVRAKLLGPVPGYATANGEDPDLLLSKHRIREVIEVEKGIKAELRLSFARAHPIRERHVQPSSESVKAGTNTGTSFSKADFRIPLPLAWRLRCSPMALFSFHEQRVCCGSHLPRTSSITSSTWSRLVSGSSVS